MSTSPAEQPGSGIVTFTQQGDRALDRLAADLVDRLELYRAPIVIGNGLHAIGDLSLATLAEAHGRWQPVEQCKLGPDSFEAFVRTRGES